MRKWAKRKHFLEDPSLELNGYQVDFEDLGKGLFFFTHNMQGCYSTMVIHAEEFFALNPAEKFEQRRTSSDDCPGYCLKRDALGRCTAECECAFVRDVMDIVSGMQKGCLREARQKQGDEEPPC